MNEFEERARDYVGFMRAGRIDDAFHGLIDAGEEIIPPLISCFCGESNPTVRAAIIDVISQFRKPESVSFLRDSLADSQAGVWKAAIDGLVTIGTPAALEALENALKSDSGNARLEFRKWVTEAAEQIKGTYAPPN